MLTTALSTAVAVAAVAWAPTEPAAGAANPGCRVVNATRGGTYDRLGSAVKAAKSRDRLVVMGACKGQTTIVNKRLTIEGRRTRQRGTPTLRSNLRGPVLRVRGSWAALTLRGLVIRGDPKVVVSYSGAGLLVEAIDAAVRLIDVKIRDLKTSAAGGGIMINDSTVVLKGSSIVKGCAASSGGGIHNADGDLVLGGSTKVQYNRAEWGGGVFTSGSLATFTMRYDSAISRDRATTHGGGIYVLHGRAVLEGRARVDGNSADKDGGGIMIEGDETDLVLKGSAVVRDNTSNSRGGGVGFKGRRLTMQETSRITANSAPQGGGLYSAGWTTLDGVLCAPATDANVFGNATDDCLHG